MTDGTDAVRPLERHEEDFLRALARTVLAVPRGFDADLGRGLGLSTSEYFALMHLSEAPGQRLRMSDLAAATALSQAATTRVVTCLVGKGLVERQRSVDDGRGYEAVLVAPGRACLERARPAHVASVRQRIFDRLDGIDLAACTAALSRISDDRQPRGMTR
jgi:DNA-binding MarR family transcriptional regulator